MKINWFISICGCCWLLFSCEKGEEKAAAAGTVFVDSLLVDASRFQENLEYRRAVQVYEQAIALSVQDRDSFAAATAFHRLGILYRLQSLKVEALDAQQKAGVWGRLVASDSLMVNIWQEKARVFTLMNRKDSAVCYYRLALEAENRFSLWQEWAALCEAEQKNEQAIGLLLAATLKADGAVPEEGWISLCRLYLKKQMPDSAAFFLANVQSIHPKISDYQSRIARQRGDTVLADFHYRTYQRQQNACASQERKESLFNYLYSYQEKELSDKKKADKSQAFWFFLLPVVGIGIYWFVRHRSVQEQQKSKEQPFCSSEIYFRFHNKEEWRPKAEDWEALFLAFHEAYPGFLIRLKKQVPLISQPDLQMCCLIKMNVTPSIIAQLLCCTNAAVSMKRGRLYQKIKGEKGTPEQFDRFIREI